MHVEVEALTFESLRFCDFRSRPRADGARGDPSWRDALDDIMGGSDDSSEDDPNSDASSDKSSDKKEGGSGVHSIVWIM